jgi:6-pyruvoyltetrahydropterin/6-carboxytetrahydropterin synthase
LHNPEFSDAENQRIYGKCNNPHGHGHNYCVEVTVSGRVDPRTGMVCNLADLDGYVNSKIVSVFDHTNLNELSQFKTVIPSTENLCAEIYKMMKQGFTHAHVERIKIEETPKNSFEYGAELR